MSLAVREVDVQNIDVLLRLSPFLVAAVMRIRLDKALSNGVGPVSDCRVKLKHFSSVRQTQSCKKAALVAESNLIDTLVGGCGTFLRCYAVDATRDRKL